MNKIEQIGVHHTKGFKYGDPTKNAAAVSMGSLGGVARAKNLSPERRKEISLLANQVKRDKKLLS